MYEEKNAQPTKSRGCVQDHCVERDACNSKPKMPIWLHIVKRLALLLFQSN